MGHTLIISNTNELYRLRPDDIIYIAADRNYSHIFVVGGDEQVVVKQLGEMERLMVAQLQEEASQFIHIGRSAIINSNYVYAINLKKQQLQLKDYNGKIYKLTAGHDALALLKHAIENSACSSNASSANGKEEENGRT